MSGPWPVEIRVSKDQDRLDIAFDNGDRFGVSAPLLRVMTPSAEARGHGPKAAAPKPLAIDKSEVRIADVRPVGRYAVRITFDDGHETGLYTWETLHRIGRDRARLEAEHAALLSSSRGGEG